MVRVGFAKIPRLFNEKTYWNSFGSTDLFIIIGLELLLNPKRAVTGKL